jgi:hypothetical protein
MYDMQAYFEVQAANREIATLRTEVKALTALVKSEQEQTRKMILEALQVQSE